MRRLLVALAATALLGGCALPQSVTGSKAGDQPSGAGQPGQSSQTGLPSDAGSLASLAQSLAAQGTGTAQGGATGTTSTGGIGSDISWPQCPPGMGIPQKRSKGLPMPLPDAKFVIVGLTNGPGFVRNPCLKSQVQWIKIHRLPLAAYSVISYPDAATLSKYGANGPFDASTEAGRLKNEGYQQATYNVGSMGLAGLASPIVWLDVEPVPGFDWPKDNSANNAAVVQGAVRGYQDAGYKVGVYGTPSIWKGIVGGLSLGQDVPEWRAAGGTSKTGALSRCGPDWSIQGGTGVLGQWVEEQRDRNLICPGATSALDTWFHQT